MTDAPVRSPSISRVLRSTSYLKPIAIGFLGMALFAGSIGVWAATAPIEGAAMAPGAFVARGQNKRIQHLEGGIVAEILAKEGDVVEAGQIVLRMDATKSSSELDRLVAQFDRLLAREARLVAERERSPTIAYAPELMERGARIPPIATMMEDQDREFAAGNLRRANEISALERKVGAQRLEIDGYRAQLDAGASQLAIIQEEKKNVEALFAKGLMTGERLFQIRRTEIELKGDQGRLQASIGRVEQGILENEQEIERLRNETVEKAASELIELRIEKAKLVNEMTGTRDMLTRTAVRSPVHGVVLKVYVNSAGEVLRPGGDIVDVLPLPSDLVVEAKLRPEDIDRIHVGQKAAIRIPALHIPYSPLIDAEVEYVSADRLYDEASEQHYYLARIGGIDLPADVDRQRLYPGMQIESFIVTEPRTFAEYLFDPLWRSFSRGLREN